MLERGVYLAPSQYEAGFMSLAHTDADIDKTIAAATEVPREKLVLAGKIRLEVATPRLGEFIFQPTDEHLV